MRKETQRRGEEWKTQAQGRKWEDGKGEKGGKGGR